MNELKKIISQTEKAFKRSFLESNVQLTEKSFGHYVLTGDYPTKAINIIRNRKEEVKVIKWYEDFWIYFSMNCTMSKANVCDTFLSLSVFQGTYDDDIKSQLFRAEWDNYENNSLHPQPHWHVYSSDYEKVIDDFYSYLESTKEMEFKEFVATSGKERVIDLTKFHFAMNGQWSENVGHIHKIEDSEKLKNWFFGILSHIREQLEHIK